MEETTNKSGMSTGMIIGIAVVVAIVFGGGAYAYVNNKAEKEKKVLNAQITELQSQVSSATSATTTTPTSSTSTTVTTDETASWKTYTNSDIGFTFKYPETYTVKKNQPTGGPQEGLILQDTTNALKPELSLWVDADGWGPFFPQIIYTLAQDGNGIKVAKREATESENSSTEKIEIMTKASDGAKIGSHYYWLFFRFNKGGTDLEPVFKQILSTFQITK